MFNSQCAILIMRPPCLHNDEQRATGYMKGPKPMTFMYEGSARST